LNPAHSRGTSQEDPDYDYHSLFHRHELIGYARPRVAGFPAKTKLEESSYTRRTFDHIDFRVQDSAILPKPHITRIEHQIRALREDGQNRKHFGEEWVQDKHQLSTTLVNADNHCGHYSSYFEGADGPVPDLQEDRAVDHAGDFTSDHKAGHYDDLTTIDIEDEKGNVFEHKAVRRIPLSSEIRQKIYLLLFLSKSRDPNVLLPLAYTCRFLRAVVISFQRANFGFAFRHPLMLRRFLQYTEPGNVLLKHKENILTFGCVMIDLRSHLTSCPTNTLTIDPDTNAKVCNLSCCNNIDLSTGSSSDDSEYSEEADLVENENGKGFHHDIFDKINMTILHMNSSVNAKAPRDTQYPEVTAHFGIRRQLLSGRYWSNSRQGIKQPELSEWIAPMTRLLKGYKV
jgi:hypothetical protein